MASGEDKEPPGARGSRGLGIMPLRIEALHQANDSAKGRADFCHIFAIFL